MVEPYELEMSDRGVHSPLLVPDYGFYKLYKRWFEGGINEEWIRVNNIKCFVEDYTDEMYGISD